jgi:hypothetical protein
MKKATNQNHKSITTVLSLLSSLFSLPGKNILDSLTVYLLKCFFFLFLFLFIVVMSSQEALQALIDGTEALGFDHPVLETIEEPPPNQEPFALIGRLLSLKPVTTQTVRATLAVAWSFVAPIAVETLAPNKFRLGISHEDQLDHILRHGPWNI